MGVHVSYALGRGEVVAFVGMSGAGQSTLMDLSSKSPACEPAMPVTERFDSVCPFRVRLGQNRLRITEIVKAQVCRKDWLVVSLE